MLRIEEVTTIDKAKKGTVEVLVVLEINRKRRTLGVEWWKVCCLCRGGWRGHHHDVEAMLVSGSTMVVSELPLRPECKVEQSIKHYIVRLHAEVDPNTSLCQPPVLADTTWLMVGEN